MPVRRFNRKRFGIENVRATPEVKGVYLILDRYDRPQYVGRSKNLSRRLLEHFDKSDVPDARGFMAYQTRTERAAERLEKILIRRHCPPYNIKDTKGCYEEVT